MQDAVAPYVQLLRDRVAELNDRLPRGFLDPDVVIAGGGFDVHAVLSPTGTPPPVLKVGKRFAMMNSGDSNIGVSDVREVQKAIIACAINRANTASPDRRPIELAGWWASAVVKVSIVGLAAGLVIGSSWVTFGAAIALIVGVLGLARRASGARAYRERIYLSDHLAAEWVGRQAVVDALQWYARVNPPEPRRKLEFFAPPTVQDRLVRLGAFSVRP